MKLLCHLPRFITLIFLLGMINLESLAQLFPDRIIGKWEGMMHVLKDGAVRDSVAIRLTISQGTTPGTWPWKTEYLSANMPMIKDYVLRQTDPVKQTYVIDEGGGIELVEQLFGNKLYCVFETHEILLTSTNELRDDTLIFEVTSGKKLPGATEVINYSVSNLQRGALKRVP